MAKVETHLTETQKKRVNSFDDEHRNSFIAKYKIVWLSIEWKSVMIVKYIF